MGPTVDVRAFRADTREIAAALLDVQCDEGGELRCEAVPDAFPVGRSADRLLGRWRGPSLWDRNLSASIGSLHAMSSSRMRVTACRRMKCSALTDDSNTSPPQGGHTEARKVQRSERQPDRGADKSVVVQGELREGVLRWAQDHAGAMSAPEV